MSLVGPLTIDTYSDIIYFMDIIETRDAPARKSIFASIDKRNDEFSDNAELVRSFTHLILGGTPVTAEDVEMVHLTGEDESPRKDSEGRNYFRRYAIWKENENHFGAWVFLYEDEDDEDKVIYPQILGAVAKKSQEIVEDVYYIEKIGLPIAWVTYHNAQ